MVPSHSGPVAQGHNERHSLNFGICWCTGMTTPRRMLTRDSPCAVSRRTRHNPADSAVRRPCCQYRTRADGRNGPRTKTLPVVEAPVRELQPLQPVPKDFRSIPREGPDATRTHPKECARPRLARPSENVRASATRGRYR